MLEMVRITAETHLATVALCHCVSTGVQVAVKMYHRERLTGKMDKQVRASRSLGRLQHRVDVPTLTLPSLTLNLQRDMHGHPK